MSENATVGASEAELREALRVTRVQGDSELDAMWLDHAITELVALRAERARPWECDACGGTGKPASDKPCMCGGTGMAVDAVHHLRKELVLLERAKPPAPDGGPLPSVEEVIEAFNDYSDEIDHHATTESQNAAYDKARVLVARLHTAATARVVPGGEADIPWSSTRLNEQRNTAGELTPLALAIGALEDYGCDCGEDEPRTCLACLCEAALKDLWERPTAALPPDGTPEEVERVAATRLLRDFVAAWDAGERESLWRGIEEARTLLATLGGFTKRTEATRMSPASFADHCHICGAHERSERHAKDPSGYHSSDSAAIRALRGTP